jgi:vibriolysin
MLKKLVLFSMSSISQLVMAASTVDLYHASLSSLTNFPIIQQTDQAKMTQSMSATKLNQLQLINQSNLGGKTVSRYQQLYKGIPVLGAQVMIIKDNKAGLLASTASTAVNGHLIEGIDLTVQPTINPQQAIKLAKDLFLAKTSKSVVTDEVSQLQIRSGSKDNLRLVYQVSFKMMNADNAPAWPHVIIDANTGAVITQWNNIKTYQDTGPGGNEKVHEYWYGKDGLPSLNVVKKGYTCIMDDSRVRLVNLNFRWDEGSRYVSAYHYACGNNREDYINGAFSPINDAYYFGHTIMDMYSQWYGVPALQTPDGTAMPLIMRVHFGREYSNAFWDGKTMSFGDGDSESFYPLVSLDVAGHEVSHGFTEQHSNLEYHDEPGSLNESFSDMAGQASRAYLLDTNRELYNKINLKPDTITWGLGETIVRDELGFDALRFMDNPSSDEHSADCLDKDLAKRSGSSCKINYEDVVNYALENISSPEDQQSYIVHTASGIFNKAFYLMSEKIGIKKTYEVMVLANSNYWTPTSDFINAACGVLYAAKDVNADINLFKSAFDQVGVSTQTCSV